ncbi:MAG: T9SS type A sorting domain-containing protein, partial [Spirochaetales bacterium]|nr:T9SS type A sorting domain-containing protein [Spirochaetales bacterium]
NPTATIAGQAATVVNTGGLNYTASYTMTGTDPEGVVAFSIDFTDTASNPGTTVTATTDASSVTFDRTAPTITGYTLGAGNAYVDVQLNEGAYTNPGSGALVIGDFTLTFLANGGTATGCTIQSLTDNTNGPLSGGESIIRVHLNVTGTVNGLETIEITPFDGNSIFDAVGNAMGAGQTTGSITLVPAGITILSRETLDTDNDGFIDQIRITTLQALNDVFTAPLSITVNGYTVSSYDTGGGNNDTVFYINLVEGSTFDTGATPLVTVVDGGNLRSDDNVYGLDPDTVGVNTADAAAPLIGVTLAASGGTRFYVEFTEYVYTDASHNQIVAGDFTYPISGISPVVWSGNGIRSAFFTVGAALTAQDIVTGTIAANLNAVYDAADLPMATTVHPVSALYLNVILPVWATDGIHTGVGPLYTGAMTRFDGTDKLMDYDIDLEVRIDTAGPWPNPLTIHYDANVPSLYKPNGYWLPVTIPGLLNQAYTLATPQTDGATTQLRNFTLSETEYVTGDVVEFIFEYTGAYCLRAPDPNDPRVVMPYSFNIADITPQFAGVTIINNVINPNASEVTTLMYETGSSGRVTIQVFSLNGDIVDVLYSGVQAAGRYQVDWDGRNRGGRVVARGIYFIKIVAPGIEEVRKVLVVK